MRDEAREPRIEQAAGLEGPRRILGHEGAGVVGGAARNGDGGDGGGAGEIGHLKVVEDGALCTCGNYGCLETVASTRALVNWARDMAQESPDSHLAVTAQTSGAIDLGVILNAFRAGDKDVSAKIQAVGQHLGVAVASLVSILNVQKIVISGELANFGDVLLESVKDEIKHRVLSSMAAESEICFTSLGMDSVILGASALVLFNELGLP